MSAHCQLVPPAKQPGCRSQQAGAQCSHATCGRHLGGYLDCEVPQVRSTSSPAPSIQVACCAFCRTRGGVQRDKSLAVLHATAGRLERQVGGPRLGAPRQGSEGSRALQRSHSGSPHSFFWRQKWQQMPARAWTHLSGAAGWPVLMLLMGESMAWESGP